MGNEEIAVKGIEFSFDLFSFHTIGAIAKSSISVDKNAADPRLDELKQKKELLKQVKLRQKKYLNNIVEPHHRGIKRLVKPGVGFGSFNTDQSI